jgi:(heptosyl)LPS beta-1,4-glucosyltransferase
LLQQSINLISLVINTFNEEENIKNCILSGRELADEIIVCDMYSTDRTIEIAESLGAKVILHEKLKFVEGARRYAIEQASGKWIFVLDADERISDQLCIELKTIISRPNIDAVRIRSSFLFMGKWINHGTWGNSYFWRFFKRDVYLKRTPETTIPMIHQNFPGMKGCPNAVFAKNRIIHNAYPTLMKFTSKTLHNYANVEAETRFNNKERAHPLDLLIKPIKAFSISYIIRFGFLDRTLGFISAFLLGVYSFLVVAHQLEYQWRQTDKQ